MIPWKQEEAEVRSVHSEKTEPEERDQSIMVLHRQGQTHREVRWMSDFKEAEFQCVLEGNFYQHSYFGD